MGVFADWYRGAVAAGERQHARLAWNRMLDGVARPGDEEIVRRFMGSKKPRRKARTKRRRRKTSLG